MNFLFFFDDAQIGATPSENVFPTDRQFSREKIDALLNAVREKTLGEVDVKGVIKNAVETRPDKVQRGIAGDVIEVSVLGCERDSRPEPDIMVDGVLTELKTTGVHKSKGRSKQEYEAKEPLTITGISPDNLAKETFENSRFYHKLEHLLFVFYHYTLGETAKSSADYISFPILGHLFWQVPAQELEMLKNDWSLVQEFARNHSFMDEEERHRLKSNLLLIDYSSPMQPRFRLKRTYVSTIVGAFLQQKPLETLSQSITKYSDIDEKCHQFTRLYRGKTVSELCAIFGLSLSAVNHSKDAIQQMVISMFGGKAKSLNDIKDFKEIGLVAKTIVLTSDGRKTEDMKMFRVDFNEWCGPDTSFDYNEDNGTCSFAFSYFSEHSFLFIIFEEPYKGDKIPLEQCRFKGFKRYSFTDSFINNNVRSTWEEVRSLVLNKTLVEITTRRGNAPNFPKSTDHLFFLRGSGQTAEKSRKKRLLDFGIDISMLSQYTWIRGEYVVDELRDCPYL